MDFMKHISKSDCAALDRMPEADKRALWDGLIRAQEWRRGLLTVHQLGELLGLGKDGVNNLPVKFLRPFRKTSRGLRQVKSLHKDDLIEFLTNLNPSFAIYDPTEGPLLTPEQAAEVFGDDLPECVQLSPRTRRYRPRCTPKVLTVAELIMQGVSDGD